MGIMENKMETTIVLWCAELSPVTCKAPQAVKDRWCLHRSS